MAKAKTTVKKELSIFEVKTWIDEICKVETLANTYKELELENDENAKATLEAMNKKVAEVDFSFKELTSLLRKFVPLTPAEIKQKEKAKNKKKEKSLVNQNKKN